VDERNDEKDEEGSKREKSLFFIILLSYEWWTITKSIWYDKINPLSN
jgi:hypothetical protein